MGKALIGLIAAILGVALFKRFSPRLATVAPNVQPLLKQLAAAHGTVYRASGGRVGSSLAQAPVLLLTTTGRKTGLRRTTPVLYLEDGDNLVIAASNGGDDRHPAWFLNLRDQPYVEIQIGDEVLRAKAEIATPEERARLWPRLTEMYSAYETYQGRTHREIPVIILNPVDSAALKA